METETDILFVLRIVLVNKAQEFTVHFFAQLRFLCKIFWDDELAESGCTLIPFRKQQMDSRPSTLLFDNLYKHFYRFSLDYRNYYCPRLCGNIVKVCHLLGELDKETSPQCDVECIEICLDDIIIKMRIRSFDEDGEIFLESPKGYEKEYLSQMKGRTLQGLMIAEDYEEGTYFFQSHCGLQFPFFINLRDGFLSVEHSSPPNLETPRDSYISEMDIF